MTTRTEILNTVVSMFNAAPGAEILKVIEDYYTANGSAAAIKWLAEIADAEYTGTNEVQATSMLANFGLTKGTAGGDLAYDYFLATLNGGISAGGVLSAASDFLNATSATELAAAGLTDAKTVMDYKSAVAEYYSVTANLSSNDMSKLKSILDGVTADAATVMAAKAAIDNAGSTFNLTSALTTLDAANTAKSDFLDGVELKYTVGSSSEVEVEAKTADDAAVTYYYTATTTELASKTGLSKFDERSA